MAQFWEFKRVIFSIGEYEQEMAKLGNEGWEAYQVLEGDLGRFEIHLKRVKVLSKTDPRRLLNE